MSNKGLTYKGALTNSSVSDSTSRQNDLEFTTVSPLGPNKHGIDTIISGFYEVNTGNAVEAGSDSTIVVVTGHAAKKGDLLRFTAIAGNVTQEFMYVKRIIDANSFELDGILTDAAGVITPLDIGDTFDLGRGVMPKFGSGGDLVASIANSPVQISKGPGGVYTVQNVTKDTTVIANTVAMPVEIVGVAGTEINITAGDIGVQLFHNTANPDSIQIGDGTEIMLINASGEAQVRDDDLNTLNAAMSAKLPATLGQKTMAASMAVVIASDQSSINVNNIAGTVSLPTGASTEAKQDDAITQLTSIAGEDFSTETTLAAFSAKFNSLGQKARAASAPVTLSTEDQAHLVAMQTSLQLIDNALSSVGTDSLDIDIVANSIGLATETTLASIDGKDFATQTTLAAISAKLPATLGQKAKAASLAVTIASDQDPLAVDTGDVVETLALFAQALNGSAGAWVQIIASTAAAVTKIQIMQKGGEPLHLATGAAAAEVVKMIVMPGGSPDTLVTVEIPAGTRLAMRSASVSAVASVDIFMNLIG